MNEHVPINPGLLHAWQVPMHAILQQTLSEQNPLKHSLPITHATPLTLRQDPPLQENPLEHATPQKPQLLLSFRILSSHPSTNLFELQSANPASHAPLHMPPVQVIAEMWLLEHTAPHAPQLSGSFDKSKPSSIMPSQSSSKPLQTSAEGPT
jgi:hypothetical protein